MFVIKCDMATGTAYFVGWDTVSCCPVFTFLEGIDDTQHYDTIDVAEEQVEHLRLHGFDASVTTD